MGFNRPQTKLEVKRMLKGKILWQTTLFLLISLAVSQLFLMLTGISDFSNRINEDWNDDLNVLAEQYSEEELLLNMDEYLEDSMDLLFSYYPKVSPVSLLIAFVLIVMSNIISAGYEWWCLLNMRKQPCDFRSMFDGFGFTFKLICHIFIRSLLITIATMFFIIPGIILELMYSQSFYILFEDPSTGVIGSLRKSRKMMKGNKVDYFVMQLSFLGWAYLGALISEILVIFFAAVGLVSLTALSTIFFNIWLTPYMGLTRAGFYNYLTGWTASAEQPSQEDNTL